MCARKEGSAYVLIYVVFFVFVSVCVCFGVFLLAFYECKENNSVYKSIVLSRACREKKSTLNDTQNILKMTLFAKNERNTVDILVF